MHKIKYETLNNGATKEEFVCMHEEFHGRKCEEAVIFQLSDTIRFAKIIKMFNIFVQGSVCCLTLTQEYCLAPPSEYVGHDWATGFTLLQLEPPQQTFFVPVLKFMRCAFIVPTMDQQHPNYYLLNNVVDIDMFFHLWDLVLY